nr:hypothetical protein [Tanacetum cinerariifolium]
MPLLPSPQPTVSYFDDLGYFKDFDKEFSAIVYNDVLTSKSDLLTEPTFNPKHIDEFDLKDETSLSRCDEVEQNVLYFNDLFPFNIICPEDLKSDKDNDNNEIDITQSSGVMALPSRDQRHQYLRYEGLQYTDADIADFKTRLARIYMREVQRVQVLDFGGLSDLMAEGLKGRMLMEHKDAQGQSVFTSRAWRQIILALGLHTAEEMHTAGFGLYWAETLGPERQLDATAGAPKAAEDAPDVDEGDLTVRAPIQEPQPPPPPPVSRTMPQRMARLKEDVREIRGALGEQCEAPKKGTMTDLFYLRGMDVDSVNVPYLLATLGPERQLDATAGAPKAAEDAPDVDEGDLTVRAPIQEPQPPPPPPVSRTMPQRMARLKEDVREIRGALGEQCEVVDSMARDFSRFTAWTITSLLRMMDQARVKYTSYRDFQIPY